MEEWDDEFFESLVKKEDVEAVCRKGVLRNFATLTGKHLCQSLFFNKVAGLKSATFF